MEGGDNKDNKDNINVILSSIKETYIFFHKEYVNTILSSIKETFNFFYAYCEYCVDHRMI